MYGANKRIMRLVLLIKKLLPLLVYPALSNRWAIVLGITCAMMDTYFVASLCVVRHELLVRTVGALQMHKPQAVLRSP